MQREYKYPVYGTQGGGLVREVAPNHYIFLEKPDCPGLDVGDDMPKDWGVHPANNLAMEGFQEFNFSEVLTDLIRKARRM